MMFMLQEKEVKLEQLRNQIPVYGLQTKAYLYDVIKYYESACQVIPLIKYLQNYSLCN